MSLFNSISNTALFWGKQLVPNIKKILNNSDSEIPTSKAVYDALNSKNNQLQAAITALNNKVSVLETDITTLTSSTVDISTKVATLQTLCATFATDINSLQNVDVALQTQINTLVTNHNVAIANLQSTDASLLAAINAIQSSNTNFTTQINTLNSKDAAQDSQIAALNALVQNVDTKWTATNQINYTVSSVNQITTISSLTNKIFKGFGLRFWVGTEISPRYAVVDSITSNTITLKGGSPLIVGTNTLKALEYCDSRNIIVMRYELSSRTFNVTNANNALIDKLVSGNFPSVDWANSKARLVLARGICFDKGTITNPAINFKLGALTTSVFTSPLTFAASNTYYDTGVTADPINNSIDFLELIRMIVTTASSDAKEANIVLTFILE